MRGPRGPADGVTLDRRLLPTVDDGPRLDLPGCRTLGLGALLHRDRHQTPEIAPLVRLRRLSPWSLGQNRRSTPSR